MSGDLWEKVAREMVAALRGRRSRAQLSRRLGYRTNTVSDWEAGRRFPAADEFLHACQRLGVDLDAAFERFHPPTAPLLRDVSSGVAPALARWLDALRGTTALQLVAQRAGRSRFAVSRWLRGQTRPRLPEWLELVEALTYRAADLADALVGVEKLPTLMAQQQRRRAARELAFEYPESEALLRVMETQAYRALPAHAPGIVGAAIGIAPEREREILEAMVSAGILELADGRYVHRQPLTIDTSAAPAALNRLKAHWAEVALARAREPRSEDWLGYNLMSLSEADLEAARGILRNAYREIRTLAAASEPVEAAVLLNLQLVTFPRVAP